MPQPSDVHVNALLSAVSVAFLQDQSKFIADIVFPRVQVAKQSDHYATYPRGDFLRSSMRRRASGTAAAEATYVVSKDQYYCDVWALARPIDEQETANQDDSYDARRDTTEFLTLNELITREVEWGAAFFTTGKWTGSSTATDLVGGTDFTQWNDVTSDPVGDLAVQCEAVEATTGFWPTDLTVTRPVWRALRNHPDILSRISGGSTSGSPALVTRELVATLFEIERVNVAAGVRNTAQEGATDAFGYILGKHALLTYRPATAGRLVPSAGYTFVWNGYIGMEEGRRVLEHEQPVRHSDLIEIEATWGHKVVSAPLGVFFSGAVA